MNQEITRGWYVLYVKSRCEKKVFKLLQQANIDAFLPLIRRLRKWSDREKLIEEPLFKSYVFTHINEPQDFGKAKHLDGAFDFIRFGNKFAKVSNREIDNIKIMLNGGLENIQTVGDSIRIGEKRIIQQGLLKGLDCEIMKTNKMDEIVVRVESININIIATLPSVYLKSKSLV